MKIIRFSISNPLFLNLLTVLILLIGVLTALHMRREAFPAVNFDTVVVSTVYPGASPKEVELYVTKPLEEQLETVTGLKEIKSSSGENLSLIIIKLDPDRSEQAKSTTVDEIQRVLNQVTDLPEEIENPPLVKEINSGVMPILEIALSGKMSYPQLHKMADEIIEKIKKIPGANTPLYYGFRDKELWVELSPEKLKKWHVDLLTVVRALSLKNLNLPGGVLRSNSGDFLVITIGEVKTADEIDQIIVRSNDAGQVVQIKDLGKTKQTFAEKDRVFRTNSTDSINIIVRKKADGDILTLVDTVKKMLADYQEETEHQALEVRYANDISLFVRNRLGVLINNGIMGMLLVLLCLLVFLSRGIAFVTALGMPIALFGAIIVMNMMGMTINLLTLFALVIVLGMLVDDAVIFAENIWQHYEQGKSPKEAVFAGVEEVFWPVTVTILTSIAAFSPLLMVSGIFGKFISSLPKVIIITLVISLIEAVFILTSHAFDVMRFHSWWRNRKQSNHSSVKKQKKKSFTGVLKIYLFFLTWVLKLRYIFVLFIGLIFASCLYLAKNHMKLILFPTEGIQSFFIRGDLPPGTSLDETSEKIKVFEKIVKEKIPEEELVAYVSYAGFQQTDAMDPLTLRGSHLGQVGVHLVPELERKRTAQDIIKSIRSVIVKAGQEAGFARTLFVPQRIGPPVGKPVAIRILGKNLEELNKIAKILQADLKKLAGVQDVTQDYLPGKDEIRIQVDDKKANRSLVSTQEIALHLRASLEGQIASHIHTSDERIPIRIRYEESARQKISSLKDSLLMNKAGQMVSIKNMAKFSTHPGITAIKHLQAERIITVTANLEEKEITSSEVNTFMDKKISLLKKEYPNIDIIQGGEYEDTTKSIDSMKIAFLFSLGFIFTILASLFRSITQPLVVMMAIPFGLIGVIISFYFHNIPLSFLGMIGMVGLSGVVVNDSIVLVDFINKARQRGLADLDAIIYAGKRRFRAVWLTSLTTIFGLLPLVYGVGGEDAFLKPAAMALAYGLVFSTVLILLFVPALYLIRLDIFSFFLWLTKPFLRKFSLDIEKKQKQDV